MNSWSNSNYEGGTYRLDGGRRLAKHRGYIEQRQLFAEIQERARGEQQIREMTERVCAAAGVDGIMQTAVQELRRTLRVTHVAIRLGGAGMLGTPDSSRTSSSDIVADAQNLADGKVLA